MPSETIGDKIKEFRTREDMSMEQLAQKAGVSKAYISQLESGGSNKPSAEILYNIALALNTTIAHLLGKTVPRTVADVEIPQNLQKIAKQNGIDPVSLQRLALIQRRDGKKITDYTEEQWLAYWLMMKNFDGKKSK